MGAQAGNQVLGLVDTAIAGHLGDVELAAVGLGNNIFYTVSFVGVGVMMGFEPLISQAVGAGDSGGAYRLFTKSVAAATVLGSLVALAIIPLVSDPALLSAVGVELEAVLGTATYVLWRLPSALPLLLLVSARAYLQSHHITRPLITSIVVANVANLVLGVLLAFGVQAPAWAGGGELVPPLGLIGVGVTTAVTTFVQLGVMLLAIQRTRAAEPAAPPSRASKSELRHALRLGLPISAQLLAEVGAFSIVGLLAARLGTVSLAAHQIALTLGLFTFSLAQGIAAAGTVFVGRAIGAAKLGEARAAGHTAFAIGAAVMCVAGLGFWLLPERLARLFTTDAEVTASAAGLLVIAALFQVFDGVQVVGSGVLRGAGDTRFPLAANLVGYYALGLPIAALCTFVLGYGVRGLWIGLCVGLVLVAATLFARFDHLCSRPLVRLAGGGD